MIAMATDSGRLVTFEYIPAEKKLKTIHFETFGKSGVRRVVPGEHFAVDPKGRAIMLASAEKNKLVYILTRSGQTDIAISSPLEAHKPQTLVYYIIGLDVGYDNPIFATLELDYSQAEADSTGEALSDLRKDLVFYELDLGLNHIIRKHSEQVDRTANIMFRVPGGAKAPSGVLICGEDSISYRPMYVKNQARGKIHRLAIPRREGATEDPNRKRIIVAGDVFKIKGGDFFYLLQTEDGDLFKVTFEHYSGAVKRLMILYFDTTPVSSSISILNAGFVFCASESGDRILYNLESLGSKEAEFDSTMFPEPGSDEQFDVPFFKPRPFKHLSQLDIISSTAPIMDMDVSNIAMEDAPQIYTVSGTGTRSTFRITRNAMNVVTLIESGLPQQATGVFSTKLTDEDKHDTLIVLCLLTRSLVLRVSEDVEEAFNTGFLADTTTLGVQQFGNDSVLQIHPRGIRHIRGLHFIDDEEAGSYSVTGIFSELTDWDAPPHRTIVAYASNNRQVAIALSSGEVYYFESDNDGFLAKAEEEISLDETITCLAMPTVPEGNVRSSFLAVGCNDMTIRIFNLAPDMEGNILGAIGLQALSSPPSSLAISDMKDSSPRGYSQYLHIGLRSGIYIRSLLDENTGEIGNTRRRFLGPSPVTFALIEIESEPAVVAMTSRPWLSYTNTHTGALVTSPLDHRKFDAAWNFSGPLFQGVICVSGEQLSIFGFTNLRSNITSKSVGLRYTPRKLVRNLDQSLYYVIESDGNTLNEALQARCIEDAKANDPEQANGDRMEDVDNAVALYNGDEQEPAQDFGHPRLPGKWASCVQVITPFDDMGELQPRVLQTLELNDGLTTEDIKAQVTQSAVSAALVYFESRENQAFLAVGVVQNLLFTPSTTFKAASIHLYELQNNGQSLQFYHATEVDDMPLALSAFKGKLIAGIGNDLCLYDVGMKSLLRKAFTPKCTTTRIVGITSQGSRLVVSDQNQSVTYVVHKELVHPNRLIPFVDDSVPRWTTSAEMLDYNTTVGGDKFGNMWVVRCPQKISDGADESNDGHHILQEKSYLGGAPARLDLVANYFTNDIPVAIQKTALLAGGEKVIFWAGLQGTLGAMIPFQSRRDFKMFQELEMILRNDDKPVSGRDHLAYRSYYTPVKSVIDGDLIERFLVLPQQDRESIVGQLTVSGWSAQTVEDAIWNMRSIYAF